MKNFYDNLLLDLCNISIKAGHLIMQFYNYQNEVTFKKDSSPITKADLAANKTLKLTGSGTLGSDLSLKGTIVAEETLAVSGKISVADNATVSIPAANTTLS